jgi:hypothetical protein
MLSYDYEFDIDNAAGVQLDLIGGIVGRRRLLDFQPQDGSSANLDDEMYRILLKAKISQNHWDGTIPGMYELWENLFPDYEIFIKDNMNMTMTAYLAGYVPNLLFDLINNDYIIPRPQGVGFEIIIPIPPFVFRNSNNFIFIDFAALFRIKNSTVPSNILLDGSRRLDGTWLLNSSPAGINFVNFAFKSTFRNYGFIERGLFLRGERNLDGSYLLNAERITIFNGMTARKFKVAGHGAKNNFRLSSALTKTSASMLDGTFKLDGSQNFNGKYITQEDL